MTKPVAANAPHRLERRVRIERFDVASTARFAAASALVALVLAATPGGCSSMAPARGLASAAALESPHPPAISPPPPPGVMPSTVAPRPDPASASKSLAQVREEIFAAHPAVVSPPTVAASGTEAGQDEEASRETRDEAIRTYLRGRLAAQEGNLPQAIGEFEQAHRLDPGAASILRQLARAYLQAGNGPRSAEAFRRLRGLEPNDPEALFSIGMQAANRREWSEALAALFCLKALHDARQVDPGASTMAAVDYAIASCLAELGYDRAFLEAAGAALSYPIGELAARGGDADGRMGELFRRRSELIQSMGDAWLRLGDPEAAIAQYRSAVETPVADPRALRARLVHALVVSGRPLAAQAEFVAALAEPGAAGDGEVALAGYLRENVADLGPLVEAVEAMSRERPDEAGLVRVLARLDPQATVRLLGDLATRTASGDAVGELLSWIEAVDAAGAVAIAADLVARNPESLDPAALRLAQVQADPATLRTWIAELPPSPAAAALETALLVVMRDPIGAWQRFESAQAEFGPSPLLARAGILAAGGLADAALVAAVEAANPPRGLGAMPIAAAYLAAGAGEEAWRVLETAEATAGAGFLASLPAQTRANWLVLVSRAAAAESVASVGDVQRAWRQLAVRTAEAALAADVRTPGAIEWLIMLRDPRNGAAPDAAAHEQAMRRMVAALEGEPVVERMRAEEELGRGRVDSALLRLDGLLERNPGDAQALQAVVSTLARAGRTAEILSRLDAWRLAHPADVTGWDLWVAAMLRAGRARDAEQTLRSLLAEDEDHPFAAGLLAALLKTSGRGEESDAIRLQQLAERPQTPALVLDRATWNLERSARLAQPRPGGPPVDPAAVAEASSEAIAALETLVPAIAELTRSERWRAISIAMQASPDAVGRSEALAALAEASLAADDAAPLGMHGAALLAAALEGSDGEAFEAMVRRAVRSRGAAANDDDAAIRWLAIAERLLQADRPAAAAEVLRIASLEIPWPAGEARRVLRAATVALDARCGGRADRTLDYLVALAQGPGYADGEALMRVDPESTSRIPAPLLDASSIYTVVGDRAGSLALLEAALANTPDDAMTLNNLAYGRLEDGLLDERTVGMMERAFELAPSDSHILDSIGWLRYRQGALDDGPEDFGAVSLLSEAVKQNGANPSIEGLDHLGDALWRAGRHDEAIRTWQRALEVGMQRFDREGTMRGIEAFQRGEFGLVVRDPADFFDENYGEVIDRVRAKLRAANEHREPAVAPWSPSAPTDPPDPPAAP